MDNITADENMYYITVDFHMRNEIYSLQNHMTFHTETMKPQLKFDKSDENVIK